MLRGPTLVRCGAHIVPFLPLAIPCVSFFSCGPVCLWGAERASPPFLPFHAAVVSASRLPKPAFVLCGMLGISITHDGVFLSLLSTPPTCSLYLLDIYPPPPTHPLSLCYDSMCVSPIPYLFAPLILGFNVLALTILHGLHGRYGDSLRVGKA